MDLDFTMVKDEEQTASASNIRPIEIRRLIEIKNKITCTIRFYEDRPTAQ